MNKLNRLSLAVSLAVASGLPFTNPGLPSLIIGLDGEPDFIMLIGLILVRF